MKSQRHNTVTAWFCGVLAFALIARQPTLARQNVPTIRVDVDLVLVNVTVKDDRNRYIRGLQKEHFRIWEDKVEQDIISFSNEDAPITLGVILDRSGSMGLKRSPTPDPLRSRLDDAKLQSISCLKDGLRADEFFLMEFSDTPQVTAEFTNDPARLREKILFAGSGGSTALWDAIYAGVEKAKQGQHARKALVVSTDGEENSSRYTLGQLKSILREQDVRIYTSFVNAQFDALRGLSDMTGGASLKSLNSCEELKADLRNQYVIGYRPTNRNKDGEFRKITVRTNPDRLPRTFPNLTVRTREGYFATP